MTIEIVDFPIKNAGSFHSYVSLPEGSWCFSLALFRWAKTTTAPGRVLAEQVRALVGLAVKIWVSRYPQSAGTEIMNNQ